jgi:AcrR family transcriptional regulator
MSHLKDKILDAAFTLAVECGYRALRRDNIAERAGVAGGTVNLHYATMENLKAAIMRRAIDAEQLDILAAGMAEGDPVAMKAPKPLRVRALQTLL